MSNLQASNPIGIFDSGVGGLTVARAVKTLLPNESLVYFGDTMHMPYGERSAASIQAYSVRMAEWLLKRNCKMILIACNSASAVAYDLVREYIDGHAHVLNVVDPVVQHIHQQYSGRHVGLIATRPTVNSQVYTRKLALLNSDVHLSAQATPLLASAIEENFQNTNLMQELLKEYLQQPTLKEIDALLLACTHYPVIVDDIAKFYDHRIDIINPSHVIAESVQNTLQKFKLLNDSELASNPGQNDVFYLSDYTEAFARMTQQFFGEAVEPKAYSIWHE